jgi:hypothetical protein
MPIDLSVAIERKAELCRESKQQERTGVLLMPLIMCLLTIIAALESPSFAAAVIASGLY